MTAALNVAGLCVFMADVYVEAAGEAAAVGRRPQELHRFLVNRDDGSCLTTRSQKRCAVTAIRTCSETATPKP